MNTWSKWIFVLICWLAVTVGCTDDVSSIDDGQNDEAENQVESNDESDNDGQSDDQSDENDNQGDENDNDGEICESPTDDELCNTAGFQCGDFETTDKCGVERTVDCGGCPLDDCQNNMCGCVPDTCKDVPNTCGVQDDGCGGFMICNTDCDNSIGLGTHHTCLMEEVGGATCFGRNNRGQLGTATDDDGAPIEYSQYGVSVDDLDVKVVQIHAGEYHTCALDIEGSVYCWGSNKYEQLTELADDADCADGDTVPCAMELTNLAGSVNVLGAGGLHTAVEVGVGQMQAWGENWDFQLGTGDDAYYEVPQDLLFVGDSSSGIQKFDGGPMHSCYLDGVGDLVCWGSNLFGESGDGLNTGQWVTEPAIIEVDVQSPIQDFSTGGVFDSGAGAGPTISGHTCAIDASNDLYCWGHNRFSQLGTQTLNDDGDWMSHSPEAVHVDGIPGDVTAVAAGGEHTCAVADGDVWCLGYNEYGQLGNGEFWDGYTWDFGAPNINTIAGIEEGEPPFTNQNPMDPVQVVGLDGDAIDIFAGSYHTCALMEEGDFKCWGLNEEGQLGDGSLLNRAHPVSVFDSDIFDN